MKLNFLNNSYCKFDYDKYELFQKIKGKILSLGFKVKSEDFNRPWGGFLVIDEDQSQKFSNQFFDGTKINRPKN